MFFSKWKSESFFGSLIIALTIGLPEAWSACPKWISGDDIPFCPSQGSSTVLPDTYPAMAHVVSDRAVLGRQGGQFSSTAPFDPAKSPVGSKFAIDFVMKTFEAAGETLPLIFMPVRKDTFEKTQKAIQKHFQLLMQTHKSELERKRLRALKNKWMDSIVHVTGQPYPWQQDYFKSFFDPSTGNPQLKFIENAWRYGPKPFARLVEAINKSCPLIQAGETLKNPSKMTSDPDFHPYHAGGNILGLPGGLTLVGSQSLKFSSQYISDQNDEVDVNTSWLKVGHVDEIFSIIPLPHHPLPFPCNFAVAVASPKKALELLSDEKNRDKPFFSNPYLHEGIDILPPFQKLFKLAPEGLREKTIYNITNGEAFRLLTGSEHLRVLNDLIEKTLESNRARIQTALEKRLPQCGPIQFIEVPDLYISSEKPAGRSKSTALESNPDLVNIEVELLMAEMELDELKAEPSCNPYFSSYKNYLDLLRQTDELREFGLFANPSHPKSVGASSILPSPANLVVVSSENILLPETHNSVFDAYLRDQLEGMGLKPAQVDTLPYAHSGEGNLHCATHSIRFCRVK